ncbi:precorrin-2 dehydrogenase/sirohydrochlorin ferrochelatase family protein [Enterococcus alishanensis]|uniref:precorrin-2 dehydrogenase n=1 Tax=Enterococcus alishanensis TaxID=1303817 RepID=A0ABS6TAX2_9ENTE|nr:bifunctional precorrin-2 dehydrogenase/sirohydrochlorin ferrochelatase [Enterococcus alishanensis]MBV7390040.1 bifunctional precorrin-2 dehydrogenase/sirohydrochlorin ferrochelatase [Enterococcus alishanensis]
MYPVLIDLEKIKIVVFGGGKIGTRKVQGLVAEGSCPVVIAPEITNQLEILFSEGKISWQKRVFQKGDTTDFQMVFICTNQKEVNQEILEETSSTQLVNDTSDKNNSNFYNLALLKQKDFSVAITTHGQSPTRSKAIKNKIKDILEKLPI